MARSHRALPGRRMVIVAAVLGSGIAFLDGSVVNSALPQIKRSFDELGGWLHRSQEFPHGVVLLTGTGVVPPNEFTLAAGDVVAINISGVGELRNPVAVV